MKELSKEHLLNRFYSAKGVADKWMSQLQQCYELVMPNKAEFSIYRRIAGGPRSQKVFDSTAIVGLKKFAANIQQMLMPNTSYWAKFKPGPRVLKANSGISPKEAQIECDEWREIFFKSLNKSNFANAAYQSLMEMGISTGVLLIQPGDRHNPFKFKGVPLHQVSVEQGPDDTIENVFRKYRLPARTIKETWPKGNFTTSQLEIMNSDAYTEMELIEGCVYEPQISGSKKYCFFVYLEGAEGFIIKEYRAWSPWVVFRWNVYAGEQFGRGPIIDMLPFIRELNQLAQFDLQAASYNANPIFLVAAGSEVNPYTARIAPGAIIPVQQIAPGVTPIQQLQIQGQPTYSQLTRGELVHAVNEALNTNPIVPNTKTEKTATEVQARQAEWLRQNQSMAGRLERELCRQVVDKCWRILHSLGMVPVPVINDDDITVEFESAIKDIQGRAEVEKALQATQYMANIVGPEVGAKAPQMGYQIEDVPTWVLEKMHVDPKVMRSTASKQAIMRKLQQKAQLTEQQGQASAAQAEAIQQQAQANSQQTEGQAAE